MPLPDMNTALIIGGLYEGLCLAIAIRLARAGHPIYILHRRTTARPQQEVEALTISLERAFKERGWPLALARFDEAVPADVARAAREAVETRGPIGIVVSGEGTNAYPPRDFLAFGQDDWDRALQRELATDLALLRTLLPHLRARRQGCIISLGYVSAYWNNHLPFRDGHPLFVNSWPFVLGKTWRKEIVRHLAISEYRYGVTINTVSPGRVRTLPLDELLAEAPAQTIETTAWHVAELAHFLSTPVGRVITGADVPVLNAPIDYRLAPAR